MRLVCGQTGEVEVASKSVEMEASTGLSSLRTSEQRSSGEKSRSRSKSSLEFTMKQYPCAKMKLDQFFLEWLSLPEYERLIAAVLDNAANGGSLFF